MLSRRYYNEESKSIQQQLFDQLAATTAMQMERLKKGEDIRDVQRLNIGVKEDIIEGEIDE